ATAYNNQNRRQMHQDSQPRASKQLRKDKSQMSINSSSNGHRNSAQEALHLQNQSATGGPLGRDDVQGISVPSGRLRDPDEYSDNAEDATAGQNSSRSRPHSAAAPRSLPRHGRSASLLSRLRHPGSALTSSPTASPTSSESSSRDTPSERTLAHSASSGSIRLQHPNAQQQLQSSLLRVLSPRDGGSALHRQSEKDHKLRSSRRRSEGKGAGGFISQLLRGGPSRSASSSPSQSGSDQQQAAVAASISQFVHTPGTPGSIHSFAAQSSHSSTRSLNTSNSERQAREQMGNTPDQFHYAPSPASVYSNGNSQSSSSGGAPDQYFVDPNSETGGALVNSGAASEGDHSVGHPIRDASNQALLQQQHQQQQHLQNAMDDDTPNSGYQAGVWFNGNGAASGISSDDPLQMGGRLVSALPVYEPIDMSRLVNGTSPSANGTYPRATHPILPDARMLAPMASLAEIFRPNGMGEGSSLSNRELRFAVENHMLVEQHRYLIRDLGHARSAIAALKQVVQAKEERLEHYEVMNVELQQRVALLETIMSPEQRQQLSCMPYTMSMFQHGDSEIQNIEHATLVLQQQQQQQKQHLSLQDDPGRQVSGSSGLADADRSAVSLSGQHSETASQGGSGVSAGSLDSDNKRINRPLSGYATGFTFNDKPVHHLPRVFSGDYSAAGVHAMESSVGVLANVITAMPRDESSVEDIIASKMADDELSMGGRATRYADGTKSASDMESDNGDDTNASSSERRQWRRKSKGPRSASASGAEPGKRRSRFLSALRLSGFGSPTASNEEPTETRPNRRSVSLGTNARLGLSDSQMTGAPPPLQHRQGSEYGDNLKISGSIPVNADHLRPDRGESLAASCPSLIPSIGRSKNGSAQRARRQHSAESLSSDGLSSAIGRYPAGLGLSSEPCSASTSRHTSNSQSSAATGRGGRRTRLANRLSFTPQPRRSTSAPSRPQSMQVQSRRSWLSRLFDSSDRIASGDALTSGKSGYMSDGATDDEATTDDGLAAGKVHRRRVMTHSSEEITSFLGKLRLEEAPLRSAMTGTGGVLEDVTDVSGEDEERASRQSLSVAEIRQQTLDALNGTVRTQRAQHAVAVAAPTLSATAADTRPSLGSFDGDIYPSRVSSLPSKRPTSEELASLASQAIGEQRADATNGAAGRWRQREMTRPTIRRLNTSGSGAGAGGDGGGDAPQMALGLGVSVSSTRRGSGPTTLVDATPTFATNTPERRRPSADMAPSSAPAFTRRASLDQQQKHRARSSSIDSEQGSVGGKKWAPAFWAPPPLNFHASTSPMANTWSPHINGDPLESSSPLSGALSDDVRYRSPRGSLSMNTRNSGGSNASNCSNGGGSPWELVKITAADARGFPLSPSSHTRPGSPPPSHALGYFEDTTVPDSDELTAAARRSLSLRLSRTAFRQAEPLPESDDVGDSAIAVQEAVSLHHDFTSNVHDRRQAGNDDDTQNNPLRNAALARVFADSVQPKRRSLLWQFNQKASQASKVLGGPLTNSNNQNDRQQTVESASVASDSAYDGGSSCGGSQTGTSNDKEHAGHAQPAASGANGANKRPKKWWSAVLG
ncbi:hypothetical protein GGI07_005753, partial [Coemansia sp. Benny D115]